MSAADIVAEPIEHSEHGASIAKRFTHCHGSVRMSRQVERAPAGAAADKGTAMHEIAAMCLRSGQDAIEYVGRTVNGLEIDASMADDVQIYLDHCRSRPAEAQRWIEERISLAALNPPAPMFGTADHMAYLDGTLWVDDLKTGYLEVEAEENTQLRYYALGAMLTVHPLPVIRVVASIVQPKRGGVKPAEFDAFDLMEWSGELLEHVAATLEHDATLTPGAWCRDTFCPAAGTCVAYARHALAIAGAEFEPVDDYRPPAPETMSSADLGRILRQAPQFDAWLRAATDEATRRAHLTDPDLGWKIIETEGREAWKENTLATAKAVAGAAPADIALSADHLTAPAEPMSPAQVRGVIADRIRASAELDGRKVTKKAAEADARRVLAPFTRRPVGTKLVPATDSTPALAGAGNEFLSLPAEA